MNTQVIRRAFLMLFFSCSLLASHSFAQMGKIDTKHISDHSNAILRIDFKQILKQVKKDSPDVKRVANMMNEELGIDLHTLNSITVQIGSSDEDQDESSIAATFEFSKDINHDQFLGRLIADNKYTEVEYKGKKYKKPEGEYDPYLYFESAKKFTLTTPGTMEHIIDAANGMGANASRIKSIPAGSELALVVNTPDDVEKLKKDIEDLFGVPPVGANEYLESVQSGFVYINFSSGVPIHLQCTFDSAEVAANAQKSLQQLITLAETMVPAGKQILKKQIEELKDAKDEFAAMQKSAMENGLKGLEIGELLLAGAVVKVKGKTVDLQTKHMGGIKDAGDLLFFGLQAFILGGEDLAPAPPEDFRIDEEAKKAPVLRKK